MDDERGPAPWELPPGWLAEAERSNPAARWALGLGIASVVPGLGLGAVAAGVIALLRAQRTRGTGRRAAAVGLALGAAFLLLDVGAVGVGVAHAVVTARAAAGAPGGAGDGQGALPDPDDRTSPELTGREQAYIDALDDVTYLNFNDETLLGMGDRTCSDLAAGLAPQEASEQLNDLFGSGTGDAWDVQRTATATLCPELADRLTATGGTTA